MGSFWQSVARVIAVLLVCLVVVGGMTIAKAQTPNFYLTIDDVSGYVGELVEIPVFMQTLADSLDGFQISLALSRPDLVYFEVDTVVVGQETMYVCQFDTVGTLASGWEHVEARSTLGQGLDLRLSGISDVGSGTTPGIPSYSSGILMKFYARILPDILDTLTDRTVNLNVHVSTSYFSNELGELIEPVEITSGSVTVLAGVRGDANCDGVLNPIDVVLLVNYVYKGWDVLCSVEQCDINCDSSTNPIDVVFLVNYVYKNWPLPPC